MFKAEQFAGGAGETPEEKIRTKKAEEARLNEQIVRLSREQRPQDTMAFENRLRVMEHRANELRTEIEELEAKLAGQEGELAAR